MQDALTIEFTTWFIEELQELPTDEQARVARRLAVLERKGWAASAENRDVAPLKDGIWEVRIVGKGPSYRLLCFQIPGDPGRIVVLTSCVKKGLMKKSAVKDAEIERASTKRALWLSQQEGR